MVEIKKQIALMHSELFLWQDIMRNHYNYLESNKNSGYPLPKHFVYIFPYEHQYFVFYAA